MSNRLDFDVILRSLLGSDNVYYQPPESVKMKYTAIKYSVNDIYNRNADNLKYSKKTRYEVVVISKKPDDPVIDKILELNPNCQLIISTHSPSLLFAGWDAKVKNIDELKQKYGYSSITRAGKLNLEGKIKLKDV